MPNEFEGALYFAGPFSLLIQIALCIHVYRTGRPYWWIWIILVGSFAGCLLYTVLEVLPDLRRTSTRTTKAPWYMPRSMVLRRARELLEDSDTVENRLNLASLLYDYGSKEAAEQTVAECVSGPFKDDADVIAEVARHKIAVGKLAEAEALISQANTTNNKFARIRLDLLSARILFAQNRFKEAKNAFSLLQTAHLGEEPRYHVALCHWHLMETDAALKVLNDITKSFRKGTALWRRSEKVWYKAARQTLEEINRTRRK